jgi:hypothetical protein
MLWNKLTERVISHYYSSSLHSTIINVYTVFKLLKSSARNFETSPHAVDVLARETHQHHPLNGFIGSRRCLPINVNLENMRYGFEKSDEYAEQISTSFS